MSFIQLSVLKSLKTPKTSNKYRNVVLQDRVK